MPPFRFASPALEAVLSSPTCWGRGYRPIRLRERHRYRPRHGLENLIQEDEAETKTRRRFGDRSLGVAFPTRPRASASTLGNQKRPARPRLWLSRISTWSRPFCVLDLPLPSSCQIPESPTGKPSISPAVVFPNHSRVEAACRVDESGWLKLGLGAERPDQRSCPPSGLVRGKRIQIEV